MRQRRGIAGILPGRLVDDWRDLAARLDGLQRAAAWRPAAHDWDPARRVSSVLAALGPADPLVAYYRHPVHAFMSAVHEVGRAAIAAFIDERVVPARGEGVDLTVWSPDFAHMIGFNHDGDVFIITPPELDFCHFAAVTPRG